MLVKSLGHVVLNVRDLRRSEAFYAGVLEMPIISRISDPIAMSFFTLGNHHDFALIEVGDAAPSPHAGATGLAHIAFKVGDSLDEFRRVEAVLDAAGIATLSCGGPQRSRRACMWRIPTDTRSSSTSTHRTRGHGARSASTHRTTTHQRHEDDEAWGGYPPVRRRRSAENGRPHTCGSARRSNHHRSAATWGSRPLAPAIDGDDRVRCAL